MRKHRLLLALLLTAVLVITSACGSIQVKDNTTAAQTQAATTGSNGETQAAPVQRDTITLRLVYASKNEKDANIVRDLLTKKGFEVEMLAQADNNGVKTAAQAGNYDIIVHASGNSAYSVDFALKYWIYTGGSLNWSEISDPDLDAMIDEAGGSAQEDWADVYGKVEEYFVDEMAYSTPLYVESQGVAVSKDVDINSYKPNISLPYLDYTDASLRDTRTFRFSFNTSASQFPTLDPIRNTSGVTNYLAPWCYASLLRVDASDDNSIMLRGSLSQAYSIAEDSASFYFLLRDDCFFTRVDADGNPQVTDHLVAGEDVVYSLLRAADKDSTPGNVASTYFKNIKDVTIVTDIDELKNTKNTAGTSVFDELNATAMNPISALAATRDDVDGDNGVYQVVRLDTKSPFVQILNYLNVGSAGIVDSEWVESINSQIDKEKYNADTDWLYGDTKFFYKDANFLNDCSFSGPYVATTADDYGVKLVKNEGFATKGKDDYDQALIKNAEFVYTAGQTEGFTALRSGDVDLVPKLANADISVAQTDSNVNMEIIRGSAIHYIIYNMSEGSVCNDVLVRKAIQSAINQADVIAAIGNAIPASSVISSAFDTGRTLVYDDAATDRYLDEYFAAK